MGSHNCYWYNYNLEVFQFSCFDVKVHIFAKHTNEQTAIAFERSELKRAFNTQEWVKNLSSESERIELWQTSSKWNRVSMSDSKSNPHNLLRIKWEQKQRIGCSSCVGNKKGKEDDFSHRSSIKQFPRVAPKVWIRMEVYARVILADFYKYKVFTQVFWLHNCWKKTGHYICVLKQGIGTWSSRSSSKREEKKNNTTKTLARGERETRPWESVKICICNPVAFWAERSKSPEWSETSMNPNNLTEARTTRTVGRRTRRRKKQLLSIFPLHVLIKQFVV